MGESVESQIVLMLAGAHLLEMCFLKPLCLLELASYPPNSCLIESRLSNGSSAYCIQSRALMQFADTNCLVPSLDTQDGVAIEIFWMC